MEDKNMRKQKSFLAIFSLLLLCASIIIGPLVQALPGDYVWSRAGTNLPGDQMSWESIASSADGTKLAAFVGSGYIYTSQDSGATWTEQTGSKSHYWRSITSSADGTKLAAVDCEGVYTSTDSGATWTERTFAGYHYNWTSVASSADGTKLAATAGWFYGSGSIYTSTDSGATWTERAPAGSYDWRSITSSADGTKLAAVAARSGSIYTSTDSGVTWTEQTAAGSREWQSITSSADGSKLAAAASGGSIYTSTDSGATWTERTAAGSQSWRSITSSADGSKLAATSATYNSSTGKYSGSIYTSTDSGATWTEQTAAGIRNWQSIASSADGTKLAVAAYGGNIWLATPEGPATNTFNVGTTTPAPAVQPAVANAVLSVTSSTCYTIKPGTTTLTPNGLTAPEKNVTLLGGLSFSLGCATPGGTAPLTVSLGTKYPDTSLLRVYKKDASSAALVDITSQVAITNTQNTTISYTLIDGGAFDEDKTVNGTIVDPIYIGLATTPAAPSHLAVTGMGMWNLLVTGASLLLVGVISILARRWVRV